MDTATINHVSLCAGYGGLDLALSRAMGSRLRTVAYSEIEAFACANLVAKMEAGLLDPAPIWTDLRTFPWEEFRGLVDIISGGYPCQPFSAAGKRIGREDPRHLWPWIADGIAIARPRICFFENVEGHVTLGLRDVIEDLGRMGYRTTWGVFSASEVGAPHRRRRVFVLAYDQRQRVEELSGWVTSAQEHASSRDCCVDDWRRVSFAADCGIDEESGEIEASCSICGHDYAECPCPGPTQDGHEYATINGELRARIIRWPSRPSEPQHEWEPPRVVCDTKGQQQKKRKRQREPAMQGHETNGGSPTRCEVESSVGLQFDGDSRELGEAVDGSQARSAYQVLLELWHRNESEEIQWPTGGPSGFLAEEVLRSGVRWNEFPQRICFFVWALQTGREVASFGLPEVWLNQEKPGDSSHRQEPRQQLRRELAYALCVLSYKIALAGGQGSVEEEISVQSVRKSGAAAWVLSETLVPIQEVWRSQLDEKTWTERAYFEASDAGHNRTDELRLLGNGVVPATAERAFVTLLQELAT